MFLSFILMNMENFCKGGGDGFRRFNGFYGFNGIGAALKETLIKSLSDLALVFSYKARNKPTRIASYLRRVMTKHCMKIHAKSDSAI